MIVNRLSLPALFWALSAAVAPASDPPPPSASPPSVAPAVQPVDALFPVGGRVVLIGDALVERGLRYGYLETLLAARFPDRKLTFRNIGWSGDSIRGLSRGYFDPAPTAEARLFEHLDAAKPNLLLVGYGMADSFDGTPGVEKFRQGLGQLLDRAGKPPTKTVLLTPLRHETLPAPWPDPAPHNAALAEYAAGVKAVGGQRGLPVVDLFERFGPAKVHADGVQWTDNG
ncbi:MAG: SGNH/GDSL hydrolase family protein, partial [Planctomycetia bacterium]